ncbi:MAG: hypothetical protein ACK4TA_09570 [Saprospiraceae bacterium]
MTKHPEQILTEREVQKISLSALRSYYRFRVKTDVPELISDVRGTGGIIADVQYSFPLEDGTRFMATLEATGIDSKDEVYYRRWEGFLVVESLAFAIFTIGLTFLVLHILKKELVIHHSTFFIIMMLLGAISLTALCFYGLMRNLPRYRYIYAVEQFKQYFADEQWISISEDVFPDQQNKYFQELRRQCIRYGFGLIQIDKNRKPQLLLAPARRDVFQHRRRNVVFYTLKQLERLQRGGAAFREQLKMILGKLPLPAQLQQWQMPMLPQMPKQLAKLTAPLNPTDPAYLFRFKRSYQNQLAFMGFGLVMIITVFIRELPWRPIRYISQQHYAQEVIAEEARRGPEPDFMMDPFDTIYVRPYDTTVVPYLAWLRSEQMIAQGLTPRVGGEVLIGMFDEAMILYDCERLYNFNTPKYMVQEGVYPDFESASQRMGQLLLQNLEINCLWMGCFGADQNQYILYFGLLQNNLPEAQSLAAAYQKKLAGLQSGTKISIRVLSKQKR